jgi:hypothetical protein
LGRKILAAAAIGKERKGELSILDAKLVKVKKKR